jgi:hypothetical protein
MMLSWQLISRSTFHHTCPTRANTPTQNVITTFSTEKANAQALCWSALHAELAARCVHL